VNSGEAGAPVNRSAGVVIETENCLFVGPDNGVFSFALRGERLRSIHRLENPKFQLTEVSRTFHGRDIFAPAAAHLSRGVPAGQFGPRVHDLVQLAWPEPVATKSGLRGEVIHLDHFGNAITNLPASRVLASGATKVTVVGKTVPLRERYTDVPRGKAVAVIGSSGLLEIAINGGNAETVLRLKCGSKLSLARSSSPVGASWKLSRRSGGLGGSLPEVRPASARFWSAAGAPPLARSRD